jgi:hypothetical protein
MGRCAASPRGPVAHPPVRLAWQRAPQARRLRVATRATARTEALAGTASPFREPRWLLSGSASSLTRERRKAAARWTAERRPRQVQETHPDRSTRQAAVKNEPSRPWRRSRVASAETRALRYFLQPPVPGSGAPGGGVMSRPHEKSKRSKSASLLASRADSAGRSKIASMNRVIAV